MNELYANIILKSIEESINRAQSGDFYRAYLLGQIDTLFSLQFISKEKAKELRGGLYQEGL